MARNGAEVCTGLSFFAMGSDPPPGARAMNEGEAMGTALWGPSLHIKNIGSHMQKTEGQL